ncbi:hypothetical protein NIES21_08190 [Anabaenopsis circularis NIES-21]|uniref:Uncharacterized protein n=1 Tax=Anabaenopsis circularis NIES-21 TaxID=1085406 RepID=A0A1Z4GBX2_9CYAN|nr:hypothetical protein NIES21_08190 [Anabaenopsis circularis NIES-21]
MEGVHQEAILKIQAVLNNQPKRQNKSYNNNISHTPRIQPLTEESLAFRLNVSQETVRKNRIDLPSTLFIAWCKEYDRAGLGWEFKPDTGLYHPLI